MPRGSRAGRRHRRRPGRRRLRAAVQRPARARGRRGRAGRAPPGHARDQDPRHGLRRRREAVAPEGHRPRPRRHQSRSPIWTGGGTVFGPQPAPLRRQGQPQGAPRRAAQRAVGARRARHDPRRRRGGVRRAVDREGGRAAARPSRRLRAGRAGRRRADRGQVLPQPLARASSCTSTTSAWPTSSARRRSCSRRRALDNLTARARKEAKA